MDAHSTHCDMGCDVDYHEGFEEMTQYQLLVADSIDSLNSYVTMSLQIGWTCQGGVALIFNSKRGETIYYQAMVKA